MTDNPADEPRFEDTSNGYSAVEATHDKAVLVVSQGIGSCIVPIDAVQIDDKHLRERLSSPALGQTVVVPALTVFGNVYAPGGEQLNSQVAVDGVQGVTILIDGPDTASLLAMAALSHMLPDGALGIVMNLIQTAVMAAQLTDLPPSSVSSFLSARQQMEESKAELDKMFEQLENGENI